MTDPIAPEPRVRACHVGGCVVLVLIDRGAGVWAALPWPIREEAG